MAAVHPFTALQHRLRDNWFDLVETPDSWTDLGPVGEGESLSVRVQNNVDGMRAIAKPGRGKADDVNHCRAAHEKIAFDLSHLLPLPIAPVVLWGADAPGTYKRGRSISCWAFPQAMKWSEAEGKGLITPKWKQSAAATFAMLRVFHSWIGDGDRKPDHLIVDLESSAGEVRFAAIDHGHTMSLYWGGPGAAMAVCPQYLPGVPEDRAALAAAADAINALDDAEVTRVVNRVQEPYLPDVKRGHILHNLLARKGNLRGLYGV